MATHTLPIVTRGAIVGIGTPAFSTTCRFSWHRSPCGRATNFILGVRRSRGFFVVSDALPVRPCSALLDRLHCVGVRHGRRVHVRVRVSRHALANSGRVCRPRVCDVGGDGRTRAPPRHAALFCLAAADPAGDRGGARRASPDVDCRGRLCRCVRVPVGPSAAGDLHDMSAGCMRSSARWRSARQFARTALLPPCSSAAAPRRSRLVPLSKPPGDAGRK